MTEVVTRAEVAAAVARLDLGEIAGARWFGGKGRPIRGIELHEAFALEGAGDPVLAVVTVRDEAKRGERYLVPLCRDADGRLGPAAEGDGAWRALGVAAAEGRTIPALQPEPEPAAPGEPERRPPPPSAALVCRPAQALHDLVGDGAEVLATLGERALGADQSNTSVVLGERLLLKAYRRLQPGLNPELELLAFLSEEVRFAAVPRLGGYVELVERRGEPTTLAVLEEYVPNGADAYESLADAVAAWLLAPGEVSVEFATEVAVDLGRLTAALHGALADARGVPELAPRPATRDELRAWHLDAQTQLEHALDVTPGDAGRVLRELAPRIAEELTVFEALATDPIVTRVHADYHLGQVLIAPDGYRVIDFEGEPTRPLAERRAHRSPLRDVASMLRSLDHAGRSGGRRAEERTGGPVATPGLDLEAWLTRARERFLDAYADGLRELGAPIEVDPALVRAFEIEKECYEFVYASTFLPEWLWAPTEGMRALVGPAGSGG